jgi:hypothetical protein
VVINPSTGVLARKTNYDFAPKYGKVTLASSILINAGTDDQILSFTLPTKGVYLINYSVRYQAASVAGSQYGVAYLSSSTSSSGLIADTEILCGYSANVINLGANYSGSHIFTASGSTTLYFRMKVVNGNANADSDVAGRTFVTYVKIAD